MAFRATVLLRFTGSCRNDGTNLSPDNLVYMSEQVANTECQLLQIHRQQLILETPKVSDRGRLATITVESQCLFLF